jgi:hypothetical protein
MLKLNSTEVGRNCRHALDISFNELEDQIMRNDNENDEYLSIKDFCERYSSIITLGSMRWILFNSAQNGSDCFVRRLGQRKLLISPRRFFTWLESNRRGQE